MRKREEIERENLDTDATFRLLLETLLDIRALLANLQKKRKK